MMLDLFEHKEVKPRGLTTEWIYRICLTGMQDENWFEWINYTWSCGFAVYLFIFLFSRVSVCIFNINEQESTSGNIGSMNLALLEKSVLKNRMLCLKISKVIVSFLSSGRKWTDVNLLAQSKGLPVAMLA